ncbi:MAG TPA: flagellar M-ring protein FliF C-terminal domain-containing protein, partial [Gammaproteobacteria bacterium]|nr:flagellar M-ring protein FliF C-terminal domain-containing protein [Gammaproteobacteria bacterium]
ERLEQKRRVEEYLTRKAAEVLDHTFGPGRALVRIDVALDFDRVHSRREDVVPFIEGGKATGLVAKRKDVSGRESAPESGGRSGGAIASNSSSEIVYEYGREVEEIVRTPGSVQRISVGLVLPPGLPAEQLEQLRGTVAMVVGIEESRGDRIALYAMNDIVPLADQPEQIPEAVAVLPVPAPRQVPALINLPTAIPPQVLAAGVVASLVVAGLFVGRARRRRRGESLSASEREQVLQDIREWLKA